MTALESKPAANPPITAFRWLAALFCLILLAAALLYQCFSERVIYYDEIALHNPIYMSLHYGKISAPAEGQYDSLLIHPPTQYLLIANLMRGGLSLLRAAGFLSVIWFFIFCVLVVSSRFPFPVQIGCLFGGFLGVFVWNEALTLRPDLMLTLCWLTGLVALETARLDQWSRWRLAVGGVFIVLPAAAHYVGAAACGALPLFALWIWKTADPGQVRSRWLWMFGGAAAVGIPTLLFVFLPHAREVLRFAQTVNGFHQASPFSHHMEAYANWNRHFSAALNTRPVVTLLTAPLFRFLIPAAFAAPALLALLPSTRGMAVASLPHLFFLLFGAGYKQTTYTGYFAAEVTLYLIAFTSVVISVMFIALRQIKWKWLRVGLSTFVTAGLAVAALTDVPAAMGSKRQLTRGVYDLEIARAAGRGILGRDAVVGASSPGVWFTGGAETFYNVNRDITFAPSIECIDLKRYFATFDAIALDQMNSWVAINRQRVSVTTAYLDGTLQARGFFFGDRRDSTESALSYMVYTARPTHDFTGYGVKGDTIYRFQADPGGDQVYTAAECPLTDAEGPGALSNANLNLDFYARLFKPFPARMEGTGEEAHRLPSAAIVSFVVDRKRFDEDLRPRLARCTIRDQVPGTLTPADAKTFLRHSEITDSTIRFPRSYADVQVIIQTRAGNFEIPKSCDNVKSSASR
jgi:hypothetical protein